MILGVLLNDLAVDSVGFIAREDEQLSVAENFAIRRLTIDVVEALFIVGPAVAFTGDEAGVGGGDEMTHIEWLTGFLSPDIFGEVGIIDEGVAVVLEIRNSIGTIDFFDRDRVSAMPGDKDGLFPRLELEVAIITHSVI